jgi:hypothetical protein
VRRYGVWFAVPVVLLALATIAWYATAPSFSDFRRDADRLKDDLRAFHREHGRYPVTLEEAGITLPSPNRYGAWRYESQPNGHSFILGLGDQWEMIHQGD